MTGDKYKDLRIWADTFKRAVDDDLAQMERALQGKTKLPSGCPSKESFAELIFRDIEKKLVEVNAAVEAIRKTF